MISIRCYEIGVNTKRIKNKSEDREKLTGDYNALVKRYKKKNLLKFKETYVNGEKIEEYYPVESLGEGDICVYDNPRIDTRNINISDKKNEYILPTLIENNFSSIMEVHSTSIVYNNTCLFLNILIKLITCILP